MKVPSVENKATTGSFSVRELSVLLLACFSVNRFCFIVCLFCFYYVCVLVLCFHVRGYVLQFGETTVIILYIFIDMFVGLCVYYSRPDITVLVDWA